MGPGLGLSTIRAAAAVFLWAGACREVFVGEPRLRFIFGARHEWVVKPDGTASTHRVI
jgi:hypothetical protein